jgi:integrase
MNNEQSKQEGPRLFQADSTPPIFQAAPTVASVLDWYLNNMLQDYSPVAHEERRRQWEMFRKDYGKELVENCRGADLMQFIASQKGCKSNNTRKRIKATINRPFNAAAALGLIAKNPFGGVKVPKGKEGRDWTAEEYQAALRVASPHFRRLLIFLRFSGARPGEARALEWEMIRHDLNVIVLQDHKTAHLQGGPRRIYFNPVMVKLLAWLARHKTHEGFVFTNYHGGAWSTGSLVKHMRSLRRRAGLKRDVTAHGLRHMFATGAIMAGVDIATLAQLVGHRALRTTARYVHLCDKADHLNDAMRKAVSNPGPKPCTST